MKNFDRDFNNMQRFIKGFIAIVLFIAMCMFGLYAYVGVKAAQQLDNPEQIGAYVGKVMKGIEQGKE